jgi:type I restriction enzyme S subunit
MTQGPYKLPEGWRWVRLGEVCEVLMGQSPPSSTYNHDGLGLPFFQGKADFGELYPTPRVWCTKPMKIAEAGDILISVRAPVGPTNLARERCCIGRGLAALRAGHEIQTEWLLFYLRSIEQELGQSGSGSTFNALTKKELSAIVIPLPPLAEQRRIVARIEELMDRVREARRLRQEAQKDAERLWQSVLAQTFPRPGSELPEGWRWVRLGEVFDLQQGASMSPERRLGRNPRPFLRTKNILWGTVDVSSVDEMDFTEEEVRRLRLQPGDLLVCEGGDVGRTAIWEGQLPLALYQNHIHRLRAKDGSVEPRFVMYWMQAAYRVFLAYQGAESRTAIPNLSGRRLKEFLAPLPPLSEQRRIVAHLQAVQEKIKALKEAQAATEAELKRLEQAILEKAFRGEL